ncbi:MAG: hypothetical protein C0594_18005 [Marinilabiliales bacterium]|nr:MAG: hypothetical protein C0594_18005 [Marinilabiliales bacterium]
MKIKERAENDRPREKLMNKGVSSLSDTEILAIILNSGYKNLSVLELARNILHDCDNSLTKLSRLDLQELLKIKGIGNAKAVSLIAAFELGKRREMEKPLRSNKIKSSQDAFNYLNSVIGDLSHEEFWILLLSRANTITKALKISQGGISGTVTDTRMILRHALNYKATGMILAHNHPSGNTEPSKSDMTITRKITDACRLMDINVLDHIIVGDKKYYSFADQGLI